MAQHVDVHREVEASSLASTFDHPADPHAAEGLAPFVDEHIAGLGFLLPLQSLQASEFIALQVMAAVDRSLEPAHPDRALGQVEIVPAQIAGLADAEAM